jgi:hypothetical protein
MKYERHDLGMIRVGIMASSVTGVLSLIIVSLKVMPKAMKSTKNFQFSILKGQSHRLSRNFLFFPIHN